MCHVIESRVFPLCRRHRSFCTRSWALDGGTINPAPLDIPRNPLHRGRRYEAILLGPTFVGDGLCLKPWGGGPPTTTDLHIVSEPSPCRVIATWGARLPVTDCVARPRSERVLLVYLPRFSRTKPVTACHRLGRPWRLGGGSFTAFQQFAKSCLAPAADLLSMFAGVRLTESL